MVLRARGSGGEARGAAPRTEPVREERTDRGVPEETADGLSIILVPTATLEAALALGRRLGEEAGVGALAPAAVLGLALKRLQEALEQRLAARKG